MKKTQETREAVLSGLFRPQSLRDPNEEHRSATWLELFFDLCFVVAVAALARDLHGDPTLGGMLRFAGMIVPIWWAWMGFTWYATAFDNDDVLYRGAMLGAMMCIVWLSASIEGVAEGSSVSFVLAYTAMRLLLVGLFARARIYAEGSLKSFATYYIVGNSIGAAIWLSSLLFPAPIRYWIWALGLLVEILTPIIAMRPFADLPYEPRIFHPEHIPERYGLFTIIVLGESILAVAVGTGDTDWVPSGVLAGGFGFLAAACIWWIYFDRVESVALRLGLRASFFWGYGHLIIYAGIAAFGVGIELTIEDAAHATEAALLDSGGAAEAAGGLTAGARWILGGGAAAFLLGISFIHIVTLAAPYDTVLLARLGVATVLLLFAAVGYFLSPLAFAVLVALMLLALAAFETVQGVRPARG